MIFLLNVRSFLRLDFSDSGYNSTEVCSEATEMEYLRKVLFEYMMGRETKVCSSHEPANVCPAVMQCFVTMIYVITVIVFPWLHLWMPCVILLEYYISPLEGYLNVLT